ncbi:MAG: hypothetical protein QM270_10795 [Bacillota bacterium]|nr:hypothetical protein [Bacillota bacterium]
MKNNREMQEAVVFAVSALIGAICLGIAVYYEMEIFLAILCMSGIIFIINFLFQILFFDPKHGAKGKSWISICRFFM